MGVSSTLPRGFISVALPRRSSVPFSASASHIPAAIAAGSSKTRRFISAFFSSALECDRHPIDTASASAASATRVLPHARSRCESVIVHIPARPDSMIIPNPSMAGGTSICSRNWRCKAPFSFILVTTFCCG